MPTSLSHSQELSQRATTGFERAFGYPALLSVRAPGRVNVIGEHVDYNGGWVLPAAIERYLIMAVRPRKDGVVRLASDSQAGLEEFPLTAMAKRDSRNWDRYVRGVMVGLEGAGYPLVGFDAFVVSSIPVGGGLSSSAALEAATGLALLALGAGKMDRLQLARLCQRAEHTYAGVPCGLMDQAAVLCCEENHLLYLDCSTETYVQTPFRLFGWSLLIINSGVAHELASGEYAKRRAACEAVAKIFKVKSLRELQSTDIDYSSLDDLSRRCVRHVVTENERTRGVVQALASGDVATAGRLLNESHASLRDDYRVSCPELDLIAATAQRQEGVAGCRMTGGGFGGSAVALVHTAAIKTATAAIAAAFAAQYGRIPSSFVTRPVAGATVNPDFREIAS